jgi:hypothetical protein
MNRRATFLFSIFPLSIFALESLATEAVERSVSPSRQFIIFGVDAVSRGAISELAEETKANLLALLGRPDRWNTAIVINLQFPQANVPEGPPAGLRFSQTGAGLKLQLDLTIAAKIDRSPIERELLRAILLEMIYRNQANIAPGTPYIEPPEWLIDGALAVTPGRNRAPLIEALAVAEKIVPLENFLRQGPRLSELDSPSRQLYRAYSLALLQLLGTGANGHARLTHYIDNLTCGSGDSLTDLKAQFPELGGDDTEKIWESYIARVSAEQPQQLLTFAETERKLDELLGVEVPARSQSSKTVRFKDLVEGKVSAGEIAALKRLSQDLLFLAARSNPVLRPIVQEYRQIASQLSVRKDSRVSARIVRLKAWHGEIVARMGEIDDYLNWFEATKLSAKSGAFAGYKAADETRMRELRRHDPLSVYLDAIAEQF